MFTVVLSTADRSPRKNYLIQTLENLWKSGVFRSGLLAELNIVDSGKGMVNKARAQIWCATHGVQCHFITPKRLGSSPDNAAAGLFVASKSHSEYVIFLEDDIEVCGLFLESVKAWMEDTKAKASPIPFFPLCAAYSKADRRSRDEKGWAYGVGMFYGTQAYVIQRSHALSLAGFMEIETARTGQTCGHDLLIKDWIRNVWPGQHYLLAPGMDFVQHIGRESGIHHDERFHSYPHFGGTEWSYQGDNGATYYSLTELKRSHFSPELAKLICADLDRNLPVYDFGCGMGKYVLALENSGFVALGIEGHPQANTVSVTPSVLSADLSKPFGGLILSMPKGSVISVEVGEHIDPKDEDTFIDNLSSMCEYTLILTWAVKGQGGLRHINELDEDEVRKKLALRGFVLNREKTDKWRHIAGADLSWFQKSIYYFERE